jgi:hypothetical protein
MSGVAEQPPQPTDRRGRRIYVYWAIALTLLALLAVFCWAVVAPVWQVRRAVMDCVPPPANGGAAFSFDETKAKRHIERLGGQGAAAQRLARYLGLPRCLAPHRDIAVRMMRPCGDAATPYLISCLTDNDRRVRVAAALVLGWNPDSRATEALVTTLVTDQSAYVRELAAGALGEIRDQSAIRPLADALSDGDKNVRREAARALAMLGDYRGIDVLVTALRDTDKIYRLRVITALEYHFGSRAIPPLSLILADEDKDVRQAAAEALKKIRGEDAGK